MNRTIAALLLFGLIHIGTLLNDSNQAEASKHRMQQYRQQMNQMYK